MVLQFNPPDWLIQDYMNRPRPIDELANTVAGISNQYTQRRQQQQAQQLASAKNVIDLIAQDPELLKTPFGQRLMQQSGGGLGNYQPPSLSTAPVQSPTAPAQEQPFPQGSPTMNEPLPSPVIAHWNELMPQFKPQAVTPTAPMSASQPMAPTPQQIASMQGRGKLGQKALDVYGKGIGIEHTSLENEKLRNDLAKPPKGPLRPVTKKQALAEGVFDPTKEIIVDPSQESQGETKQERLGASLRKELTSSKQYQNLSMAKSAADNIALAAKDPGAYGDLATLFDYMKALDPTSVVREGEQDTFRKTGSFTQSMANTMTKLVNGQSITPEQRQEIVKYTRNRLRTAHNVYKNHAEPTLRQAKRIGADPLEVDPYYGQTFEHLTGEEGGNSAGLTPAEQAELAALEKRFGGKP